MRLKLIATAVILGICGLLWRQVQQNGELKATNNQYLTTINAQSEAMKDLAERHIETDLMLADSRAYTNTLNRKAQGLEDDLRKQNDECNNRPWSSATIERVRQFRAGED